MRPAFSVQLLWTHICERSARPARVCEHRHRIAQAARDSKVGNFEIAAFVYHQVRRLEIAVNNTRVSVRVIERGA